MLNAGFLERNLLTEDIEIDYNCMTELSYEYLGQTDYIELYVNDFYIGILPTEGDDCERYNTSYIIVNYEVIFLEDITNRKPN